MDRRSFLSGTVACSLGSTAQRLLGQTTARSNRRLWPDPAANHVVPYLTSGLTHGPVLGAPKADGIRIWIRTKEAGSYKVVVDTRLPLSAQVEGVEGRTQAAHDNTGVVELTGLRPDTRYFYGVVINGQLADTRMELNDEFPSFWTLPAKSSYHDPKYNPAGRFNFSFSVGCCADQHAERQRGGQYGNPPVFATMMERHGQNLSFHLMNGDFIYEELRDGTMNGVRANYKLYYERGRTMSKLFRHVPVLFTFDDHEISTDDGAGEVGLKKGRWLDRDVNLTPWYEYAGWSNYESPFRQPLRFGKAAVRRGDGVLSDLKADFRSLKPEAISTVLILSENRNAGVYRFVEIVDSHRIRIEPVFDEDEECTYSIGTHHYYDWKVGNCHFFALDCRGESNRYLIERVNAPGRYILGTAQVRWLMEKIRQTDAEFIFIVSGVSWVIYHTDFHVRKEPLKRGERSKKEDGFNGAVVEREKLLNFFDSLDKQVVILTGDLHNAYAVQISDNIWEFMVGPMNSAAHPRSTAGYPPAGGWFEAEGRKVKIKWMLSFPDELDYTRLHPTVYGVVSINNVLKSGRQDGPGLHWIAYDSPQAVVQFYDGYSGELLYAEGISRVDITT